ncbi:MULTISPECIES: O-antigen polymerase [unclassified Pseudoalteromonas]|uniref:O-antigen polymerase n=1 Tax=unclassified Pseudoalteromonas TaxID=194690 RepID=UPI0004132342|nr:MULTISPECIES: O-antigen polymerase [unclassified Pseudoalteromonas]
MNEKFLVIRERFNILLFLGYLLFSILIANVPLGNEELFLILSYYTFFFFVLFILNAVMPFKNMRLSGKIVIGYVFFAYVIKSLYVLFYTENVKAFNQISIDAVMSNYTLLLPKILIPALSLVIVIWITSSIKKRALYFGQNFDLKMNKFYLFIITVLLGKFFIHNYLGWGVPGVEPKNVIPGITGLLTFFVRFPLFCIVNVFFIFSIQKKSRLYCSLSFFAISLYILIDLLNGSKYSLIYEVFFLIFALYYSFLLELVRSKTIFIFIAICIVILPIYKYINYIRFATMEGVDIITAIEVATINVDEKNITFLDEFINRINGIEHSIYGLLSNVSNFNFDLTSLFTDQLAVIYTESVTGIGGIVNSVGASQIAVIILNSNNYIDSFLLSLVYFSLSFIILRKMFFYFTSKILFTKLQSLCLEVMFSLFYIYFLFGTGNFIFFLKEMVVITFSFFILRLFIINNEN